MSKEKHIIAQIVNRKPIPIPTKEFKEDGVFLNIHETIISQIVEAKNNREFEFVCSQIQKYIEENNIGVCFAINKNELADCLLEHQKLKTQISDLESKLAESENTACKHIAELTRIATKKDKQIEELKQRLAESEEAIKYLKGIKRYDIGEMLTENAQLKQQLAEKEKELKFVKEVKTKELGSAIAVIIENLSKQIKNIAESTLLDILQSYIKELKEGK